VHRWLQRMAEDALAGWDAKRIGALQEQIARELAALGVASSEIGPARERVVRALANALEDARGRWLLGPRGAAASELRLRTAQEGRLRTLIIDRTFMEDGVRWIVDYKTSSHEGAGLEAFLDEERSRYAPQLARYAAALGSARLGLYFPMLRGWREWGSEA
jgi:ATP-dependent helicase/nuclease subunit A